MGAVAMDQDTSVVVNGYPIYEATLYIYCDRCGSFNLKSRIPLLLILALSGDISVAIIFVFGNIAPVVFWIILFSIVAAFFTPNRHKLTRYKCKKCQNTKILFVNSLNYPPYDASVIDVPERKVKKLHIESDVDSFENFT